MLSLGYLINHYFMAVNYWPGGKKTTRVMFINGKHL